MVNQPQKQLNLIFIAAIILFSCFLGGCAIGTTRIDVNHDPLTQVEDKKEGNILVNRFVDKRDELNKDLIGNKRNGFGMVLGHLGLKEGVKLEAVLTKYFAEALEESGYNVAVQEEQDITKQNLENFDLIINGEIDQFWLDLYMAVWHYLDVNVEAIDPVTQSVVWEKTIQGNETNTLWFGTVSEFEKVISQSMTKALNRAVEEFTSNDFYIALSEKSPIKQEQGVGSLKAVKETKNSTSTIHRFKDLKNLYDNGLITKDEYDDKRNEILESL